MPGGNIQRIRRCCVIPRVERQEKDAVNEPIKSAKQETNEVSYSTPSTVV